MRLTEIRRPSTRYDLGQLLRSKGYESIGHRGFSEIFARPGAPSVLKVFANEDHAYVAFVNFALANPSPHWPQFKGGVVRITDTYSAVRMERLTPFPTDAYGFELLGEIRAYEATLQGLSPEEFHGIDFSKAQVLKDTKPSLAHAMDMLGELTREHFGDVQPKNLAMRGDVVVFLDPIMNDPFK